MKKLLVLAFIAVAFVLNTFAQNDKPLNKITNIHYFKNGKVATYEIWEKQMYGHAFALDKNGKEFFSGEIGYFGGSHNVEFTYYPDGGVATIHVTGQPDGGIQHHDVKTYYSNDGALERTEDNSIDGQGRYHLPTELKQVPPPPNKDSSKSKNTKKAVTFYNEFYMVNKSRLSVKVTIYKGENVEHITIAPGDTVKGGQYSSEQSFQVPSTYYHYGIFPSSKKLKGKRFFTTAPEEHLQVNDTTMKYFVIIKEAKVETKKR